MERRAMVDPLPHLGSCDLRRRSIFHEVVESGGPRPAEPRLEVLNPDADVRSEAGFGHRSPGHTYIEDVFGRYADLLTRSIKLVQATAEDTRECVHGFCDQVGG